MMMHEVAVNSCAFSVPFLNLKSIIHAQLRGNNLSVGIQVCLLNSVFSLLSDPAMNRGMETV